MKNRSFEKEVMKIAIPVALQSMLQSSFSMVDQIMVGQLGEKSIAGIEIAGKLLLSIPLCWAQSQLLQALWCHNI